MRNATLLALLMMGCDDSGVEFVDTGASTDTNGDPTNTGSSETTNPGGEDPFGMVAAHNAVRSGVQPAPDVPLPMMEWDADIAAVAQAWADRCDFNHSDNQYGENLYVSSAENEGTRAVESWAEEVDDYQYESNQCRPGAMCGHYTQIVWRDSTKVGCAFTDCANLTGAGFGSGRLWVCNYDPPGNWVGEWPY